MKYKFKDNIVFREESDEYALLFNADTAEIQVVDPMGGYICHFLDSWVDVESILEKAKEDFDGEISTMKHDIEEFIFDLHRLDIVCKDEHGK